MSVKVLVEVVTALLFNASNNSLSVALLFKSLYFFLTVPAAVAAKLLFQFKSDLEFK